MHESTVSLQPHPASAAAVESLAVTVSMEKAVLNLRYELKASAESLRIPPSGPAERRDGLWKQTCFEVFLTEDAGPAYQEFNFSPSGAWAHYRFSDYRQALPNDPDTVPPTIKVQRQSDRFTLAASLVMPHGVTALGLSAVLEDNQGQLRYWALGHPAEEPDFHHPHARTLLISAP